MKIADTISVDPSKTALGHVETPSAPLFRANVLESNEKVASLDIIKVLFPTNKAGAMEYQKYAVPLRTLFGTILIVTGISMLEASLTIGVAITSLCFGAFLALGLLTRPVMLGAAAYYCISGALAIRSGSPDLSVFSLMFGCLVFAVIGSGKYSIDTLIRSGLVKHRNNSEKKRKENMMGYKAFHSVRY